MFPSNEIVEIIRYLLPGFVAAWIFFGLTAYPKPSQFERVVQALIFTALCQVAAGAIRWAAFSIGKNGWDLGEWTDRVEFGWTITTGVALGLLFAWAANRDMIHKRLRKLDLTKMTSFPTEWFGAFNRPPTYIVLHLTDGRRLYGWPEEWPNGPAEGHFSIMEAEWLIESDTEDDGSAEEEAELKEPEGQGRQTSRPLRGVERILVPGEEVRFVEFMEPMETEEDGNGEKGTAAAAKQNASR